MEAFNPPNRQKPPPFSRSNTLKPAAPGRVSTAPLTSKKPHLHSLHHPHRHHHHHHAKDTIQSAIQLHPPSSFGDLLKQTSRSSNHSPAQSVSESRRESTVKTDGSIESTLPHPKLVRREDVVKERTKAKAREEELRSSLQALSEHSFKTTRRLDDTYYSILEKLSMLRSTIGGLHEISALTKELHESFQNDADDFQGEIEGQIDAFNGFEVQQQQIEKLEERIRAGREKADAINARLEEARKRVEAREKIEGEWEAKMSRRLRVLWGVLGTLAVLCVAFLLLQRFRLLETDDAISVTSLSSTKINLTEASVPPPVKEMLRRVHATTSSSFTTPAVFVSKPSTDCDPRLRIFDEL